MEIHIFPTFTRKNVPDKAEPVDSEEEGSNFLAIEVVY